MSGTSSQAYDLNGASNATTATFTTSLVANMISAGVQLALFVALRCIIKAVYEPRTYIPPKELQAPALGRNVLYPLWRIIRADSREILDKNGVDPYVFIRFLHMMAKALIPIWLLSWAVLLPINAVGQDTGATGLDQFTSGNIDAYHTKRYWAHLILDYIFVFWIIYLMWGEMQHWLVIRQKFLINAEHSKLPQANTVLVQGIPLDMMDEERLSRMFVHLPGGVKRVWLNRNLKELPSLYERQQKAAAKLENAQVQLIKFAGKYKHKREAKIDKLEHKHKPVPDDLRKPINADMLAPYKQANPSASASGSRESDDNDSNADNHSMHDSEAGQPRFLSPEDLGRADQLVPRNKRPMMRLKPHWAPFGLGFLGIGKKVDTIDWARSEIAETAAELETGRKRLRDDITSIGTEDDFYPPLNSAFVYFNQQIAAHMAEQILLHHKPYHMSSAYIEQSPEDVVWFNLNLGSYQLSLRRAVSLAVTTGIIVVWAIPVAFIGALANVAGLVRTYPWMSWLLGTSGAKRLLQGVITGILPPVLLALVNMFLPSLLRLIITFQGIPTKKAVELKLMTRYFVFLVVNTFFVVTVSGGILRSIPDFVNNPASIPVILSNNMPKASTFFITLILTQFTGTAGTLLQPITLVFYYIRVILGGGTPRSIFNSRYRLQRMQWGQQFPAVTVYAVIMLAYMVISPIITGFGAAFFVIAGTVFKYLFIWVYDQPPNEDSGGLFFPRAITHVFVGLYIQQVALCAFFFLLRNDLGNLAAVPQGALMVVLIVATAAVHYTLIVSYKPLISALPLSLAHMSYGMPKSDEPDPSMLETSEGEDAPSADSSRPASPSRPVPAWASDRHSASPISQSNARLVQHDAPRTSEDATVPVPRRPSQPDAIQQAAMAFPHRPYSNAEDSEELANLPPTGLSFGDALVDAHAGDLPGLAEISARLEKGLQRVDLGDTPSADTAPGKPKSRISSRRPSKPSRQLSANSISRMPSSEMTNGAVNGVGDAHEMQDMQQTVGRISGRASSSDPEKGLRPGPIAQNGADARRDSAYNEDDNPFFAVPGGPGVRPRHIDRGDDLDTFLHPASKEPQRVVWLPRDELGLCEAEVQKNEECGVRSSSRHAVLVKGKVRISGRPPDDHAAAKHSVGQGQY